MISHDQLWSAIDQLAKRQNISVSMLAKKAQLDSTAFNKSKRVSSDGRKRWPSTESIAKVLDVCKVSFDEFSSLVEGHFDVHYSMGAPEKKSLPLVGMAQAGAGGFYEEGGFPYGHGFETVDFPNLPGSNAYALSVKGDSMMPVYRDGDRLIVEPGASVFKGDRVVVRTQDGEVMAKVLESQSDTQVVLSSLNPAHETRIIERKIIDWVARIIWASQ